MAADKIAKLRAEREERARTAPAATSAAAAALAASAAIAESGLVGLPAESAQHVRSFLPPVDAIRFGMSCSRLRAAILLEPTGWEALEMRAVQPLPLRTDDALHALAALAQGSLRLLDCSGCPLLSRGMVAGVAQANAHSLHTLRAVGLSGGSAWSAEQLAALQTGCPALRELRADVWVDKLGDGVAASLLQRTGALAVAGLKVRNAGSADAAEAGQLASATPSLEYLVLEGSSSTALGVDGAVRFGATLAPAGGSAQASLTRLECPRAYMLDEGVCALTAALAELGSVQQLALASNTIRAPGARAIQSMCERETCALATLDVRYNEIGALGAPHIGALLRSNRSLTQLDLRFNGIDNFGIIALAEGLEHNRTLQTLDLTGAPSVAAAALDTRDAVAHHTPPRRAPPHRLATRALCGVARAGNLCQIGGAERLGEALALNTTLRVLELDSNRLTAKGAVALANGLLKNKGLRKLTVGGNSVKEGAKKFASALQVNKTLEWLELGANGIDDDGCDELSWALAGSCMLTHLVRAAQACERERAGAARHRCLRQCPASHACHSAARACAPRTRARPRSPLVTLPPFPLLPPSQDLSRNDLTSGACEELADALRANSVIRSLDLATCRIGDDGAAMLADALSVGRRRAPRLRAPLAPLRPRPTAPHPTPCPVPCALCHVPCVLRHAARVVACARFARCASRTARSRAST